MKPSLRKRMVRVALIMSLAVITVSALANAHPSIRIIEKGVYRAETVDRMTTHGATGVLNTVKNPRLISDTVIVYGKLGARFGLRYKLLGITGSTLDLKLVIRFPPEGLRDPATGARYFESTQVLTMQAGIVSYWEYHLENDWEIVPGVWEFEFWTNSNRLSSQKFCIVDGRQDVDAVKMKECLPLLSRVPVDLLGTRR